MFAIFPILCLILSTTQVLSQSALNENSSHDMIAPSSAPIAPSASPEVAIQTLVPSAPYESSHANGYESVGSSYGSVGSSIASESATESPKEYSYGSTTTDASTDSVQSSTVLTPYELYQMNWCRGMLRSSAPKTIPLATQLTDFEQKYVIPEYRSLWYRTCYLPYRGVGLASILLDSGLGLANTALREAVGTAGNVFGTGSNIVREMLNRARAETN